MWQLILSENCEKNWTENSKIKYTKVLWTNRCCFLGQKFEEKSNLSKVEFINHVNTFAHLFMTLCTAIVKKFNAV